MTGAITISLTYMYVYVCTVHDFETHFFFICGPVLRLVLQSNPIQRVGALARGEVCMRIFNVYGTLLCNY